MLFHLKIHFFRKNGRVIEKGTVFKSLQYDLFVSEILSVTPTVNKNGSELKFEDTTPNQRSSKIRELSDLYYLVLSASFFMTLSKMFDFS